MFYIQDHSGVDVEIYMESGVKMRITADEPDVDAAVLMLTGLARSVLDEV